MKYFLVVLGCQMNISDSERVRTVLEGMGYKRTEVEEEADILGVIACSVRQKAIDKVHSRIHKWNKSKNRKNVITFLSGCVLPDDERKFLKLFDIVLKMGDLNTLPQMINQYGITTPVSAKNLNDLTEFWDIDPNYESEFEAFIPIQNGCNNFCTYCAVPYTRGRELSRPSEEIISEVIKLVESGFKQITLLGQNVNSYGLDKKGEEISFPELLTKLGQYGEQSGEDFWLYFTAPHPKDMTEDLLEVMAQYPVLAKQIHLPIQSGDNTVLERMNRKYSVEEYGEAVASIRKILPEATIFTDIIVGFSGETDEQFEKTRLAMEKYQYNMAYIACYSPRPGAQSHKWEDDVTAQEKKRRLHVLSEEMMKSSHEYNKSQMGKEVKVLVSGRDRKNIYYTGTTEGKVLIRFKSDKSDLVGSFVKVKITQVVEMSMEGVLCE